MPTRRRRRPTGGRSIDVRRVGEGGGSKTPQVAATPRGRLRLRSTVARDFAAVAAPSPHLGADAVRNHKKRFGFAPRA